MISVIIPLYNKAASVASTLDSVIRQTEHDFELIIVNDGSTDDSVLVVEQWINSIHEKGTDISVRLVNQPNSGVSSARNRGAQEAAGEYFAFLDADDIWDENYLAEQKRMIKAYPEAAMWATAFAIQNGDGVIDVPYDIKGYEGYIDDYLSMGHHSNIFFVCVCVVRRSAFDAVGGYDTRIAMGEDLDFSYRVALRYRMACNLAYCGLYYRQDAENRAMAGKRKPLDKCLAYYIEKFEEDMQRNASFAEFFGKYVASYLEPYYFEAKDIMCTKPLQYLPYDQLPFYMRWQYKMPFLFGKLIYVQLGLLKNIIRWIKQH